MGLDDILLNPCACIFGEDEPPPPVPIPGVLAIKLLFSITNKEAKLAEATSLSSCHNNLGLDLEMGSIDVSLDITWIY